MAEPGPSEKRLAHLQDKYAARVSAKSPYIYNDLLDSDPTPQKLYAHRLMEWYVDDRLSMRELARVQAELALYDKHKKRVAAPYRDIGKLPDPAALSEAVRTAITVPHWCAHLDEHSAVGASARHKILDADPDRGFPNADWMLRQYSVGNLLLEDLPTITARLKIFSAHRTTLDPQGQGVVPLASPDALYHAVKPYMAVKKLWQQTPEQIQADADFLAKGEIVLVGTGTDFRVLKLKSKAAAIHYGFDSDWCTSRTSASNQFHFFRKDLFAIQSASGRRYQLHFGDRQCMDEDDQPVNLAMLCNTYPGLAAMVRPAAERAVTDIVAKGYIGKYEIPKGGVAEPEAIQDVLAYLAPVPDLCTNLTRAVAMGVRRLQTKFASVPAALAYADPKASPHYDPGPPTALKELLSFVHEPTIKANPAIVNAVLQIVAASGDATLNAGKTERFLALAKDLNKATSYNDGTPDAAIFLPQDQIVRCLTALHEKQDFRAMQTVFRTVVHAPALHPTFVPWIEPICRGLLNAVQTDSWANERTDFSAQDAGVHMIAQASPHPIFHAPLARIIPEYTARMTPRFEEFLPETGLGLIQAVADQPELLQLIPRQAIKNIAIRFGRHLVKRRDNAPGAVKVATKLLQTAQQHPRVAASLPPGLGFVVMQHLLTQHDTDPKALAAAVRDTPQSTGFHRAVQQHLQTTLLQDAPIDNAYPFAQAANLLCSLRTEAHHPVPIPPPLALRILGRFIETDNIFSPYCSVDIKELGQELLPKSNLPRFTNRYHDFARTAAEKQQALQARNNYRQTLRDRLAALGQTHAA